MNLLMEALEGILRIRENGVSNSKVKLEGKFWDQEELEKEDKRNQEGTTLFESDKPFTIHIHDDIYALN